MENRVLLVEDDAAVRFGVARFLERNGFVVAQASSCATARELFQSTGLDAVVTDFRLPDGEALDFIADFRRDKPTLPIFLLTGYGSIDLAVRAVKRGASNVLTKPVDLRRLVEELRQAAPLVQAAPASPSRAVRASGPVKKGADLADLTDRLKDVECPLLILGETGTGKTRLVRALHEASRRRSKAFVDINCAGLARDLLESELFGHERGAFTSAHAAKAGLFEQAHGGTLFLDEIGDIDVAVQPKVLKAIEEKRFRRVGSSREHTVDVRIVSATHRDLREAVRTGAFRADLYYRMSTVTVTLPPLRDRRDEIPLVARQVLESLAESFGRDTPRLTPEADAALKNHAWPGNIRELKNVLERACHLALGDELYPDDLLLDEPSGIPQKAPSMREAERALLEAAFAEHGHVGEAARSLGISRSSMYAKLKAYGLLATRRSASRIKVGA